MRITTLVYDPTRTVTPEKVCSLNSSLIFPHFLLVLSFSLLPPFLALTLSQQFVKGGRNK
jgi:hypothetical protein